MLLRLRAVVVHQGLQVLVEDLVLLVGQRLETGEGAVELLLGLDDHPELLQARAEGVAAGVLAHHQLVGRPAHVFGPHDLVGFAVLEHAILVDARLVGEGIGTDDGLVRLHRKTGDARHQLGGRHDVGGIDARVALETSRRVRTAITISSREALPARSPRPLIVHST
jgi:hypothetical protein